MVAPSGVRHLQELLSVIVITLDHGDIDMQITIINGVREIFWLPVILTNITFDLDLFD